MKSLILPETFLSPCAVNPSSRAAIFPIPACPLHSNIKGKSVWLTNINTHTHTHLTYISKFIQRSSTYAERSFSKTFLVTRSLIPSHSKGKGCLFPSMAGHKASLHSPSSSLENSRAFTPPQPLTHSSFQPLAA